MAQLNWWAIVIAAASAFLLGGPWYSKAFLGRIWNREAGRQTEMGGGHPAKVFGLSFLFALIAATAFAYWLGPEPALPQALGRGLLAGGCFVAASFGINYQFANRSTLMWLIDGGYHTVQFLLYGLILGLWH